MKHHFYTSLPQQFCFFQMTCPKIVVLESSDELWIKNKKHPLCVPSWLWCLLTFICSHLKQRFSKVDSQSEWPFSLIQHAESAEKLLTEIQLVPAVQEPQQKLGQQTYTSGLTLDDGQLLAPCATAARLHIDNTVWRKGLKCNLRSLRELSWSE